MKSISHAVYGEIRIASQVLGLTSTPHVALSRHKKQLSNVHYVFPSATHTRYTHMLGVAHLAREVGEVLGCNQGEMLMLQTAGLLHDIGHGPYSHEFEAIMRTVFGKLDWSHETMTERLIDHMRKTETDKTAFLSDAQWEMVKHMITGRVVHLPDDQRFLVDIIHNSLCKIDVDKMDYLCHDFFNLGIAQFDVAEAMRIIRAARLVRIPKSEEEGTATQGEDGSEREGKGEEDSVSSAEGTETRLGFSCKVMESLKRLFEARLCLHESVCMHHTVCASKELLIEFFRHAEELRPVLTRVAEYDVDSFLGLDDHILLDYMRRFPGGLATAEARRVELDRGKLENLGTVVATQFASRLFTRLHNSIGAKEIIVSSVTLGFGGHTRSTIAQHPLFDVPFVRADGMRVDNEAFLRTTILPTRTQVFKLFLFMNPRASKSRKDCLRDIEAYVGEHSRILRWLPYQPKGDATATAGCS